MITFDTLKLRLEAPMADKKKVLGKGGVVELAETDLVQVQAGSRADLAVQVEGLRGKGKGNVEYSWKIEQSDE